MIKIPQPNTSLARTIAISKTCVAKNRIFKSAMSEELADSLQNPTEEHIRLYQTWANGGAGVLVTGNVMVDRAALGEPRNVVFDKASDIDMFRRWANAGLQQGAQMWMQLNHPGKQMPSFLSKEPVAPSAIPLGEGTENMFNPPRALEHSEIENIIEKFAWAAGKAKACGFSGVQIHAAHGYLISQFLSPLHNQRDDQWGGSLENRMRFILEVFRRIRLIVGDEFPVAVKLNSADFQKGGFTEEESIQVIATLQGEGVDLIEISGGTFESMSMTGTNAKESTLRREAYFLEYAHKAQKLLEIPLVVTGGFRTSSVMAEALDSGATDLIGLARPMAVDPELPNKLMRDRTHNITLKKITTGFPKLDYNVMLDFTWYKHQLSRIAKGKPTNPDSSAWLSVIKIIFSVGTLAFKRLRA